MRHTLLPLLLIVGAALVPATRPAVAAGAPAPAAPPEQVVVQVQHVEYEMNAKDPAIAADAQDDIKIPADATPVSSLEVGTSVGGRFETVAVVQGTTYRLAGRVERPKGSEHLRLKIDYSETSGGAMKNVTQISSMIMTKLDKPTPLGGFHVGGTRAKGLIATIKPHAGPVAAVTVAAATVAPVAAVATP